MAEKTISPTLNHEKRKKRKKLFLGSALATSILLIFINILLITKTKRSPVKKHVGLEKLSPDKKEYVNEIKDLPQKKEGGIKEKLPKEEKRELTDPIQPSEASPIPGKSEDTQKPSAEDEDKSTISPELPTHLGTIVPTLPIPSKVEDPIQPAETSPLPAVSEDTKKPSTEDEDESAISPELPTHPGTIVPTLPIPSKVEETSEDSQGTSSEDENDDTQETSADDEDEEVHRDSRLSPAFWKIQFMEQMKRQGYVDPNAFSYYIEGENAASIIEAITLAYQSLSEAEGGPVMPASTSSIPHEEGPASQAEASPVGVEGEGEEEGTDEQTETRPQEAIAGEELTDLRTEPLYWKLRYLAQMRNQGYVNIHAFSDSIEGKNMDKIIEAMQAAYESLSEAERGVVGPAAASSIFDQDDDMSYVPKGSYPTAHLLLPGGKMASHEDNKLMSKPEFWKHQYKVQKEAQGFVNVDPFLSYVDPRNAEEIVKAITAAYSSMLQDERDTREQTEPKH